jgi:tetratricopeptide (TPR) repeat protein
VLMIGTPMAERLLYLPAIAFAGCAVAAVSAVPRRAATAILAVAGLALGARTWARNLDWKDERTLWTSAAAASPGSYKTHLTLAAVDPAVAVRENDAAVSIVDQLPDEINTPIPYINGGRIYRERGEFEKALALLQRGDRIRLAHEARNRLEHPESPFTSSPLWAPLYQELGRVNSRLGRFDDAIAAFRTALRFQLAHDLFEEMSVAYFRKGDSGGAAVALLEGIVADPGTGRSLPSWPASTPSSGRRSARSKPPAADPGLTSNARWSTSRFARPRRIWRNSTGRQANRPRRHKPPAARSILSVAIHTCFLSSSLIVRKIGYPLRRPWAKVRAYRRTSDPATEA